MDWELSKENIQPLRSGRDMKALQSALDHSSTSDNALLEEKLYYEKELRAYSGDDPIDVWVRYIRWTEQHYPSGKEDQLRGLIQKCLKKVKGNPRYTNDTRYLYVWLKFAQLSATCGSLGIYEFMDKNEECTQLAQFYIQWACELERAEDFHKAAEIYRAGMQRNAEPKEKLEYQYELFEERMARRMAIQGEETLDSPPEETRNFLGVLKGIGKRSQAPFIRQSSGDSVRCISNSNPSKDSSNSSKPAAGGFKIFDEEALLAGGPATKNSKIGVSSGSGRGLTKYSSESKIGSSSIPVPDSSAVKENFRAPGTWNNPKMGRVPIKRYSSAESSVARKADFKVYQDEGADNPHRRQTIAGDALQSRKEKFNHPLAGFMGPDADKKEVRMYRVNECYMGGSEFSIEELRGIDYGKRGRLDPQKFADLKARIMALNVMPPLAVQQQEEITEDRAEAMDCSSPARTQGEIRVGPSAERSANQSDIDRRRICSETSGFQVFNDVSQSSQMSERSISKPQPIVPQSAPPFQVFSDTPLNNSSHRSLVEDRNSSRSSAFSTVNVSRHSEYTAAPSQHKTAPVLVFAAGEPTEIPENQVERISNGNSRNESADDKFLAGNHNLNVSRAKTPVFPTSSARGFEKTNAMITKRTPLACIPVAETVAAPPTGFVKHGSNENLEGKSSSQSSGKSSGANSPQRNPMIGNTSFTQRLYKDAMAVFSDTLQIGDWVGGQAQNKGNSSVEASGCTEGFEAQFRDCQPPAPKKSEMSFQIFDENEVAKAAPIDDQVKKAEFGEEDKENMVPFGYNPSTIKRQTSGVLSPAEGIVTEPLACQDSYQEPEHQRSSAYGAELQNIQRERKEQSEQRLRVERATAEERLREKATEQKKQQEEEKFARPKLPVARGVHQRKVPESQPTISDCTDVFDANEPTLAKFGEVARERVFSTPYYGVGPPPLCFSAIKPWEDEGGTGPPTDTRDPFQIAAGEAFESKSNEERELFIPRPALPSEIQRQKQEASLHEQPEPMDQISPIESEGQGFVHSGQHQGIVAGPNQGQGDPNLQQTLNANERRLSIIQETSREFRSGSTSCSSAASDASSRRKAMSSVATPTPLQPISEYRTYAGVPTTTPGSHSGAPPMPMFDTREMLMPYTPYDDRNRTGSQGGTQEKGAISIGAFTPANKIQWDDMIEKGAREGNLEGLDHAVRRLSMGQGVVSVQIPEEPDCDENCEKTGFGIRTHITGETNPWDPTLIAQLLMRAPRRLDLFTNYHSFAEQMPPVKLGKEMELGGELYKVTKLLGEGAFARAYKAESKEDGKEWVLKVQKPSCPWEFYICEELRFRFCQDTANRKSMLSGIMQIKDAFLYNDGSFLVNEYHSKGTFLDLMNKLREAGRNSVGEFLALFFTIEMMKILDASHYAGIIHADVKPDNFLLKKLPMLADTADSLLRHEETQGIKLIDWGRSIDMTLFKEGTTFTGTAQTSGFQCVEMQEGKQWTFQTDFYGMLGTVHVLLFGSYMNVFKSKTGEYRSTANFKRKWNVDLWKKLFHGLLNIQDCKSQPNLRELRMEMEEYFRLCLLEEWDNWEEDVNVVNQIYDN